jgi:uncharacterized protein (TIGR04255 family)
MIDSGMRRSRSDLPDFDNPPVVEVYLSVQFEPLRDFDAGHLSVCWQELREEFPKAKNQLPLAHELEQFGTLPERPTFAQIQFGVPELQVRLALTSIDDARLVQIQADRFVHNWRKATPDASYPRYEVIRERFENYFRMFSQTLSTHGLGQPKFDQCEVSYINHIPASEQVGGFPAAARVFRQLQDVREADSLPPLEDIGVRARYVLRDAKEDPIGRLHTLMQPVRINGPEDRVFLFTLLVRGRPAEPTLDSALEFCDLGRVTIVRAFAALTTPEMHKLWGRRDAA